jgi:DNA repair protein RecN (Recombination protein N)
MLEELYVENLGIIAASRIEPGPGLVAVTGETGAGKTLLLGALRLLRGDPARADRVGPRGPEARVEGRFAIGDDEVVVARRVAAGKSKAYVDGEMVPVKALADRLEAMVEIVEQHEHVSLGRETSLRRLVDGLLDASGRESAAAYAIAWDRLVGLRGDRDRLGGDARALTRELDFARHEAREIEGARLHPGEDVELKATLGRIRHAAEIIESVGVATAAIDDEGGAADRLRLALDRVRYARDLDPSLEPFVVRLEAAIAEIDEVAADLRNVADGIDHDPAGLRAMEDRAAAIADLKRKYGATVDEVIAYGADAAARAAHLGALVARAETITSELETAQSEAAAAGEALAEGRRRAGKALTTEALSLLGELGFRDPVLSIDVVPATPGPHGSDRVTLSFASTTGLTPGPVSRVASGGELSRLVLAVRVAAGVADADVVAFDEIDTGVGGATALAMGELLARLATGRQVLVVTHLPQIAAFADSHFVVERGEDAAVVRRVVGDERIGELTRMLSGIEDSTQGRGHASELLALAGSRKPS